MKILKLEAFSNLIYISPTTDISVLAKAIIQGNFRENNYHE